MSTGRFGERPRQKEVICMLMGYSGVMANSRSIGLCRYGESSMRSIG